MNHYSQCVPDPDDDLFRLGYPSPSALNRRESPPIPLFLPVLNVANSCSLPTIHWVFCSQATLCATSVRLRLFLIHANTCGHSLDCHGRMKHQSWCSQWTTDKMKLVSFTWSNPVKSWTSAMFWWEVPCTSNGRDGERANATRRETSRIKGYLIGWFKPSPKMSEHRQNLFMFFVAKPVMAKIQTCTQAGLKSNVPFLLNQDTSVWWPVSSL